MNQDVCWYEKSKGSPEKMNMEALKVIYSLQWHTRFDLL